MSGLTWRQIEIFHAVMSSGTLTHAAKLLHSSQPTLSRELARLEQQVAVPLFRRLHGRLQPTQQGLRLFEEVQRSWFGLQRIQQAAQNLAELQQAELTIACLPVFSQSLLPIACSAFLQQFPAVNMTIIPQEPPLLEEWLSAQRFDLGLTENTVAPAGTRQQTLLTADEVCVLPSGHQLADRPQISPEDLRHLPFISLSRTDSYRQLLDQLFHSLAIPRRLHLETHSAASVCAMVAQGCGVSIINPLSALDYLQHGVVMRRFSQSIPFTVSMITPSHRPSSAACDSFSRYLIQTGQKLIKQIDQSINCI